jgi:hypothetical protein
MFWVSEIIVKQFPFSFKRKANVNVAVYVDQNVRTATDVPNCMMAES